MTQPTSRLHSLKNCGCYWAAGGGGYSLLTLLQTRFAISKYNVYMFLAIKKHTDLIHTCRTLHAIFMSRQHNKYACAPSQERSKSHFIPRRVRLIFSSLKTHFHVLDFEKKTSSQCKCKQIALRLKPSSNENEAKTKQKKLIQDGMAVKTEKSENSLHCK